MSLLIKTEGYYESKKKKQPAELSSQVYKERDGWIIMQSYNGLIKLCQETVPQYIVLSLLL